MSPRTRVVVLGEDVRCREGWERTTCASASALAPHPLMPVLVLLGDDAIEAVAPASLERAARKGMHVVLAPRRCSYARVGLWVKELRHHVTTTEDLDATVDMLLRRGVGARLHLEVAEWWPDPVVAPSAAHDALEVVQILEVCHSVEGWAKLMRLRPHVLHEVCTQDLGRLPQEVLFIHIEAQVAQARNRGFLIEPIARALGYGGAAALEHAFKRRGRVIPPKIR